MSQYDFGTINPDNKSGTELAGDLNNWRDAVHSLHRGSSRPSYAVAGMHWIYDTSTPWNINVFDGVTTDTTIATYNNTTKVYTPVLVNLQVTGAKLAANTITLNKLSRTGTAGQVLTSGGEEADPSYQTPVSGVEAGTIIYTAKNTAPTGYLKANGAEIPRSTYAKLFAAIGTTFGAGDGSTTFNLPDLRGEFVRGWDDGRDIDVGRGMGTNQSDAFKSHNHVVVSYAIAVSPSSGYTAIGLSGSYSVTNTGASGGTETRPRNVAMLACIKY